MQPKQEKGKKKLTKSQRRRRKKVRRILWRVGLCLLTAVALILVGLLWAGQAGFKGPSRTIGDLLTVSMLETSALKFVPRIYYSKAEVEEIVARNEIRTPDEETDTSLITISAPTPEPSEQQAAPDEPVPTAIVEATPTPAPENLLLSEDGIDILEVRHGTFTGYMMIVHDPSRVTCGTCRDNFTRAKGLQLKDIAKRYNALAAINGGGFEDDGGSGNGGQPLGLVVSGGEVKHTGNPSGDFYATVGFDKNNIMHIGKMSASQAKKYGIRDAMTYGPKLIVNGKAASVKGFSSGLNPRTAIGQRADGAVLMLVIDGRQASSLGATYADLISVMMEYGAVNAINLDGGSSSLMYYKGSYLNKGVTLTGSRNMPTAFIVR